MEKYYRRTVKMIYIPTWSRICLDIKIVEKLHRRAVKSFMDLLILVELTNSPMSGYDVIGLIQKKFGFLVSPGTVYSLLYSMERDGLIKGTHNQRKRVYVLTEKGKQNAEVAMKANKEITSFLQNISLLS